MGGSPSRGAYIEKGNDNTAPGQYDDGRTFGHDTKTFTIGEKRETKIVKTLGPGAYSPERADGVTRVKTTNITMGTSPSRAELVTKTTTVGPGEYEHSKQFG